MKKCPNCNAEISENSRFCIHCMTSLGAKEQIAIPRPEKSKVIYLAGGILCLLVLISAIPFFFKQGERAENSLQGEMISNNEESFFDELMAESEEEFSELSAISDSSNAVVDVSYDLSFGSSEENENSEESEYSFEEKSSAVASKEPESSREVEPSEEPKYSREEESSNEEEPSSVEESSSEEDLVSKIIYGTYGGVNAERVDGTLILSGVGEIPCVEGFAWYSDRGEIKEIIIKDGITSIGDRAFESFQNVTKVSMPNSVTSIGNRSFCNCISLEEIDIPNSVTSIGESAFAECSYRLTSIVVPNSVTKIGKGAFYGCVSLSTVTLSNSISTIESETFSHCYALSNVVIPNSVKKIGDNAFEFCTSIAKIEIPNSVMSIAKKAFYACSSLNEVTIGTNVTVMDGWAFANCPLTSVTFLEPNGWEADGAELDLTNSGNNAKYLSSDYSTAYWSRN